MTKQQTAYAEQAVRDWLTPERLVRINALRERAGEKDLSINEAMALILHMDREALRDTLERIG